MRYLLLGAGLLLLDQATKAWVIRIVPIGGVHPVIRGLLRLRPAANFGAAFSLLPHWTGAFVAVAVVTVAVMLVYFRKLSERRPISRLGVTLAVAGAVGNLLDRLRFGFVRDFIDVRWYPAIFNVADVAIVTGIGVLLLVLWREEAS